jgi:aminopeptidase N
MMDLSRRRVLAGGAGVAIALLLISWLLVGSTASGVPQYEIDLDVNWDDGTFTGVVRVTLENTARTAIDELAFRLFANEREIYGNAAVRVLEASSDDEAFALGVQSDATVLPVLLSTPLAPGQTTSLALRFEGIAAPSPLSAPPESTGYGILTKNPRSLVLTAFYPILAVLDEDGWALDPTCGIGDALWSAASDYSVTLRAIDAVSPATSGRLVSSKTKDGHAIHRFEAESARDFSLVLTLGYEEAELQSGGTTLRSWFTPPHRVASATTLELASAALAVYERRIGPLPSPEIEIIEVPLYRVAGVEFSGLILVSSSYAVRPFDRFYDIIVSHEMAHQWFYGVVGSRPADAPWLDEGLATYLSNLFLEETRGEDAAATEIRRWQEAHRAGRVAHPDLRIASPACLFPDSSTYSAFVYDAAAWFFHSVRYEVGDEAFFDALRLYYAENANGIGTEAALLASFENACGCDLGELYGTFGFGSD